MIPGAAPQSDHERLCEDLPLGRFATSFDLLQCGNSDGLSTYLSLDVDFYWRDESYWGDGSVAGEKVTRRIRGPILELSIQTRLRPLVRWRKPTKWDSLDVFGQPGLWPLDRFRAASGVDVNDLMRLAELSRKYNRNLPVHAPGDAVTIPFEVKGEIRAIVGRLTR